MIIRHFIHILILGLLANSAHAQTEETKTKIESIKGEWHIDNLSGNVYHLNSVKKPLKSNKELFDSINAYIPKFYENIKMLDNEEKWKATSIDSTKHQITIKGRSGIVYSLFSSELYTQDILHFLTISINDSSIDIKIEHTTFRKKIGLRNPTSEDLELKNIYPINLESSDKDFYGNSFYNLHKKITSKLNDFESYILNL